jgi:predicted ATPase
MASPIVTNWRVITGTLSSGKSTLCRELNKLGYSVLPEAARQYLEEKQDRGVSPQTVRVNDLVFQLIVLTRQIAAQESLSPTQLWFLDRAVPDSGPYLRAHHLYRMAMFQAAARRWRYLQVFFLEGLPVKPNSYRLEDVTKAKALERGLIETYQSLGYDLVRVPAMEGVTKQEQVLKRVKFVLELAGLPAY